MNSIKYLNKTAFIAVLFFVVSVFGQVDKIKNDCSKENLKGKVKSFSYYTYKAIKKGRKIKKGEMVSGSHFNLTFSDEGNKIQRTDYDDSLQTTVTYNYDEKGNLTYEYFPDFHLKHIYKSNPLCI